MTTQTKTDPKLNDIFDVQSTVERLVDVNVKAGNDFVDLYEKSVEQLLALQVEIAEATKLPAASTIAKAHADVSRKVAATYVDTARQLLKA